MQILDFPMSTSGPTATSQTQSLREWCAWNVAVRPEIDIITVVRTP